MHMHLFRTYVNLVLNRLRWEYLRWVLLVDGEYRFSPFPPAVFRSFRGVKKGGRLHQSISTHIGGNTNNREDARSP